MDLQDHLPAPQERVHVLQELESELPPAAGAVLGDAAGAVPGDAVDGLPRRSIRFESVGFAYPGRDNEVFTGLGRLGATLATRRAEVEADIVCLAKGLTGGNLPLAATLCRGTYFSAFFREKTGITFKYWEDLRRIERAASRLRGSDDSISTIANESFEDLTTFERTFRRIMGMAPRDYRNAEKRS